MTPPTDPELHQCSVCQSAVPTKAFPYRTDIGDPEGVCAEEMPLDDPRTRRLCFVCATTLISESNQSMHKSGNRIAGAIANMILDAIATGKDPRAEWCAKSEPQLPAPWTVAEEGKQTYGPGGEPDGFLVARIRHPEKLSANIWIELDGHISLNAEGTPPEVVRWLLYRAELASKVSGIKGAT